MPGSERLVKKEGRVTKLSPCRCALLSNGASGVGTTGMDMVWLDPLAHQHSETWPS